MKNLSWADKLLFFVNSIVALMLLISLSNYYISPIRIAFMSFLGLSVPFLILLNLGFTIYWIIKLKRQFLVSTLILLISFHYVTKFYNVKEKKVILSSDIKIMSYNVRLFNLYKWIDQEEIDEKIFEFINDKKPDILCLQEYYPANNISFKYPYKYVKIREKQNNFGHAIFSNFKIINTGSLNFPNSSNNAIYADIVRDSDTIRIYNIHLESLKIDPKKEEFSQKNSDKLRYRVKKAFKIQTNQATLISQHQESSGYKTIICGDFNNNAFSWVYGQLIEGKNDAFEVAGKGFGKTYDYTFPFRIDFILTDKEIEVNNFKSYKVKYSDHYPIMARVGLD